MTQTILAFGDSNTYGTSPIAVHGETVRFGTDTRWPTVMAKATGATLIEEGLPGRTATTLMDPLMGAHMNGQLGLQIALNSHGPIDRLLIMLGTNDMKMHFGLSAEGVCAGIAALLGIAQADEMQDRHGGFETLVIAPPAIIEVGVISDIFYGARAKSLALPAHLRALAEHWGVGFFDAGQHIDPSQVDGVHFEPESHVTLGTAVAAALS